MKVLLLGEESRIVLPIVRSLGRCGIEVHLGWTDEASAVTRSRYLSQVVDLELPGSESEPWQSDLLTWIQANHYDLVLPVTESAIFHMQSQHEQFRDHPQIHLLDHTVYELCRDKLRAQELAQSMGIAVPDSVLIESPEMLTSHTHRIESWLEDGVVIVKPRTSVCSGNAREKEVVRRAQSIGEIESIVQERKGTSYVLQRMISGQGVGIELLVRNGTILTAFQHRRLHETTGYGSTYRESARVDPRLLQTSSQLMSHLNYTGVAMVEMRHDVQSDEYTFLEINARFWGSLALATSAGVDFPKYLVEMLVYNKPPANPSYRVGARCRDLLNDARWLWSSFRQGWTRNSKLESAGWSVNRLSWKEWCSDLLRWLIFQDQIDSWASDDPGPFIAELQQIGHAILSKLYFIRS